jgi:hypothetical protein
MSASLISAPRNRTVDRSTAKARRVKRVLCEALEERQLMSLTIELRAADGSASATVNTVGQQITLNIIGVVAPGVAGASDTNISASNPNTFGIGSITGSFVSSANTSSSTAVAGNLTATVAQPFQGPGSETGKLQDLNGDGNIDVGSTVNSTASNDYWLGQSETEVTTGTVVGNTKQIILGTVTYTVTSLHAGGETDINYVERVKNFGYFVGNWFDGINYADTGGQGHYANEYLSNLSAGTPFVLSDPALFVAPVANADTASVVRSTPTAINVLANDVFDRPADDRSLVVTTAPTHGTAIPQSNGTVLYTPSTGYTGPDTFSYTVDDTDGRVSNAAAVSITVVSPPPPVAGTVTASTLRNQPATIAVLPSDTATSPATIVPADVVVATVPTHGTAVPQSNGSILYTPTTGYTGTDSFTYTVEDTNSETSAPGTVNITVSAPTPPTAGAVSDSTTAGAPVTINVLSSDTATSGTLVPGSVAIVTAPTNGTAVAQADGTIIYTPTPKYSGTDLFTYTVADSLGDVSTPATVSLTIAPGVPPVANPVTAPAVSGQTNTINVISNASSGAPLVPSTVAVVTPPANGTATVNTSTGTVAYVPNPGFVGTDNFTYTVGNTNGDTSAPGTVSVDVGTTISSTKGSPHVLTFTDGAGGAETVTINRGSAELFFSGTGGAVTVGKNGRAVVTGTSLELSSITLSGTVAGSVFSIRGSAKAPLTIGGITDNSPLGQIIAPQAVLSGTVSLAGLGVLNVGSINSATIGVGSGGPARLSLTTGAVTGSSLYSAVPINTLRAASWTGQSGVTTVTINGTLYDFSPGGIKATSINSLSIAGGFNVNLNLPGIPSTIALGTARIGGAVSGGTWSVGGPTRSVIFGSVNNNWSGAFGSLNAMTIRAGGLSSTGIPSTLSATAIGSLVINGDLSGLVSAASAKLIRVNGNINGSSFLVTGSIGQLIATGSLTGDTITVDGNITNLTAASANGTNVLAGVTTGVTLATATAANLGSATIGTVRLTGRTGAEFTNSEILAGKITTASLGNVTTNNSGTSFGLGVKTIGSFAGIFGGSVLHLPRTALASDTLINSYLTQQGVSFGDFEILIPG